MLYDASSSNVGLTRLVIYVNLLSAFLSLSTVPSQSSSSKLVSCSEFASNHFEFKKFVTNSDKQARLGLAMTKLMLR